MSSLTCEKGGQWETRSVSIQEDVRISMNRTLLHEDAPRMVVPQGEGWTPIDTPLQVQDVEPYGGRAPDEAPEGYVHFWYACRDDLPRPVPADVELYVDVSDYDRIWDLIHQTWPALRGEEWIHIHIHESWRTSTLLDPATEQMMILVQQWFPSLGNWKGNPPRDQIHR